MTLPKRNFCSIAFYLEKFQSPKNAEMAKNGRFVGPRGPNYDPFFKFFANHFKICKETPY